MFLILLNFLLVISSTYGARILGIVSSPSYGHQVTFYPLWKELSLRGHHLTLLTTDPINNPKFTNLTEIDLSSSYKIRNTFNLNEVAKETRFKLYDKATILKYAIIDEQLQHPKVQDILKNETEHFDLVMLEFSFPAMTAFAERFKCPFILMSPIDALSVNYYSIGNPFHPILYPDFMLAFPKELNFFQRLMSVGNSLFMKCLYKFSFIPSQQEIVFKHFGNNIDLEKILSNPSMLFINTNPILHPPRPLLPNVIRYGSGTHIMPSKQLPKDLQQRLDNDPNGFIYFSLGSGIKSNLLSEDTRKILLETFAELSCTVLWKFEEQNLPGKPDNVIISKWFPQQDILRHPKIKVFITQGGFQSVEEAIFNHIPIIGMPFVGDQPLNIRRMVENGMGLSVDYNKLEKASFKEAILEVMNNPKYRNKIKELAELARDQPMTGLERAIWWTEYVIRHKGAKHLRSPALDIPFYQYFLLDVIGFCLLVVLIIMFIIFKITKMFCRFIKRFVVNPKVKTQ